MFDKYVRKYDEGNTIFLQKNKQITQITEVTAALTALIGKQTITISHHNPHTDNVSYHFMRSEEVLDV